MEEQVETIRRLYEAFNVRDLDILLASLHPDVDWPNGWEGGRVHGRGGVRDYWTRQWAAIDPMVTPTTFTQEPDGRIAVHVHQLVKDKSGATVAEGQVDHIYTMDGGLVRAMEIREAGAA